jgi:hypothetical protein
MHHIKIRHVSLSVCSSVRLPFRMEQSGYHYRDFHEKWIYEEFWKNCREYSSLINTREEKIVMYANTDLHL